VFPIHSSLLVLPPKCNVLILGLRGVLKVNLLGASFIPHIFLLRREINIWEYSHIKLRDFKGFNPFLILGSSKTYLA